MIDKSILSTKVITFDPVDLEPPVGDITSIGECQEWGNVVSSLGANYFYFSGVTNECEMFSTLKWSCDAIRGPAVAPPLEECQGDYQTEIFLFIFFPQSGH